MVKFLVRRLGLMLLTMFIVSIVVFAITEIAPGSIARRMLGVFITPEQEISYNAQLGLEEPPKRRWEVPDEPADQVKGRSLLIAVLFWWMWWR